MAKIRPFNESGMLHRAMGCSECHDTGFKGQIGVYEVYPLNAKLRHLVSQGASKAEIDAHAKQAGHLSLADYAAWLLAQGHTTLDELTRGDLFDGAIV